MDHDDDKPLPLPSFARNLRLGNISMDVVEFGSETTRRVRIITPQLPSISVSTPEPGLTRSSMCSSIEASEANNSLKRSLNVHASSWILEEAPVLPEFHPLELSAVFCPHSTAQSIASRVSCVLKERSIHASYNDAEALCLTMDNVEFSVFLYRGKKEFNHGIICEVLRLAGHSISFRDDTEAILLAAQDKTYLERPSKKLRSIPVVEDDLDIDLSASSLQFLRKLFQSGMDSQRLGLQILISMTDSSKIGTKTATATSHILVEPGNEISESLLNLVKEPKLAMFSLMVLANVAEVEEIPMHSLKPLLISHLLSTNAQLAYYASRCLKPHDLDAELFDALSKARQLGSKSHLKLLHQVKKLLQS